MHANSSERVSLLRYGLIMSGASLWPRKITVDANTDSILDVPMILFSAVPNTCTKTWMTRR